MPLFTQRLLRYVTAVINPFTSTVESPRDSALQPAVKPTNDSAAGPSVVAVEDELNSSDDDGDIGSVEPKMPSSAAKKRGRPSLSRSQTPAKPTVAKTPRSAKTAPTPKSSGRKRKAPEPEEEQEEEAEEVVDEATEPARKRGRPTARAAAVATSVRLAAKAAVKPTRGRPKGSTNTTVRSSTDVYLAVKSLANNQNQKSAAAKPTKGRAGRPRKEDTNGDRTATEEYEVEEIVESAVDAVSKEHMYLVKWKGYPHSDNTWEPKANLAHASELVKEFDTKKKAAAAEKRAEDKAAKGKKAEEKKQSKAEQKKSTKTKAKKINEEPKRVSGRTRSTRGA